ncbi:chemotaxis protein CheW [Desulfuribacillus stibiiarsenatis]|uniref:Chemotaxis protein CheW n=1 Tax=Desulfuribacillus stibiiarsenatis TaxID=1390249 RepID=A0A1E5L729_9FIRM|nr:chemotaxis protein CheW [Desulfuribacillus stibiiarsenatis]
MSMEIKVIVFRLDSEEYGVEVNQVKSIERVQNVTKIPQSANFVKGIINLRGNVTPIIDLRTRLGMEYLEATDSSRVIIVGVEGMQIGLIVDSANDVIDIPGNLIEAPPKVVGNVDAAYLRGVAKLDDRLLILLNLDKVLDTVEIKKLEEIGKSI